MLYLEARFKDTIIGSIPSDWDISMVKETGKVVTGKTPSTKNALFWNGDVPFVTPTDINHMKLQGKTERRVTESGLKESNEIPSGSLMVTCIASIGKNAISKERCCTNQQINSIIPNTDFDVDYLYYMIKHMKPRLEALAGKTAVPILNKTSFEQVRLAKPKRTEQQKIAEVLSNIDIALQKTDELVISSQRLKKGLMQSLLTKGIGHKKFEETEIGKIPAGWEIKKVMDLFEVETGTTPATRNAEYWENGTVTWLTPTDLSTVKGVYLGDSKRKVTDRALKETNLTLLPKGSILLSTRAPVGYAAIIMQDSTFNQGCKGLIPKANFKSTEEFYCYYLIKSKTLLQNLSSGSTFKELAKDRLENFLVPVPPVSERHKISEILLKLDKELEADRRELIYLRKIKKGFMNELLSGKVRVK